jgi:hypothetical protein
MSDEIGRFAKTNLRPPHHLFVFVLTVFAILGANLILCLGAATAPHKQISKEKAIALAKQITGYPQAEVERAEQRQIDNSFFPFGRPKKRQVWAITLKGISLTNRTGVINRYITGLTVLLEAETGRLLRIDSVPPATGGLKKLGKLIANRKLEREVSAFPFLGLSSSPKVTFAQALTGDPWPSVIPKAKQISAFLVTSEADRTDVSEPPRRVPYWIILAGGFSAHVYMDAPDKPATEVLYVIWAWEMDSVPFDAEIWFLPKN